MYGVPKLRETVTETAPWVLGLGSWGNRVPRLIDLRITKRHGRAAKFGKTVSLRFANINEFQYHLLGGVLIFVHVGQFQRNGRLLQG